MSVADLLDRAGAVTWEADSHARVCAMYVLDGDPQRARWHAERMRERQAWAVELRQQARDVARWGVAA